MKKFLLFIAVLLVSIATFAQPRSEQQAKQIASEFFNKKPQQKAPMLSVVPQQKVSQTINKKMARGKASSAQHSACFIINDEANNCFVIVSADERLYEILGYSDNGCFNADEAPDGLMDMISGYDAEYDFVIDNPNIDFQPSPQRAKVDSIGPLIKSKWGQRTPFNNDCPLNKRSTDGSNCASGCVATAMAQVMNYHHYPSTGIGSYSYTSATQKHYQSMDFSQLNFNWENMLNTYVDNSSEAQKTEVAKLMHACGISVSMDYGNSSDGQSSACPYDIAYAMINYFGYNPNTVFKMKDYHSLEEWDSLILQELKAGRPMLYGGRGTGGHRFILDGCDDNGLYHFNFGWTVPGYSILDGYANGYYSLDAIRPKDIFLNILVGEEVDLGNYTNEQSVICQISPNVIGNHEDVFYTSSFNISASSSVKVGKSVNCWFRATNYSSSTSSTDNKSEKFKGEVGIGLFDTNWNFIKSLYTESFNKHSNESARIDHDVILDASSFNSGNQYFIAPYAKASIAVNPTRIRTYGGYGWYLAEVEGSNITLTKDAPPELPEFTIQTGTLYVSAYSTLGQEVSDTNEKPTEWILTLTQDPDNPDKYWFDNFDPAVDGICVYGVVDKAGTSISIPIRDQNIGENLSITSYTNNNDIIINLSAEGDKRFVTSISDAWGTVKTSESGDHAEQEQLSFYVTTLFSYEPPVPVPVSKPQITVNDAKMLSIACSTDGAEIHYTLNGEEPKLSSTLYSKPIQLTKNCIVKAVAFKDDKNSETAEYEEKGFVVDNPVVNVDEDEVTITISCSTPGAAIYYTTDETSPLTSSTRKQYTDVFSVKSRCLLKVIATKDGYTDSETIEWYVGPIVDYVVIHGNEAGKLKNNLEAKVGEDGITTVKNLAISGSLNGTDIAFIRDMINNYSLSALDIENANIVSGGEPYYVPSNGTPDYITDNVVGKNMFDQCEKIITLKLPYSVTMIESFAFWNCKNLRELHIPASCITVKEYAIYGCSNLESIYLEANVTNFDANNCSGCNCLKEFYVNSENTIYKSIDGVLYNIPNRTLVKYPMGLQNNDFSVPDDVEVIGNYAFDYANFTNITLPDGLTEIGSSAFADCRQLTTISIPSNVKVIGNMAFWGCSSLFSIDMPIELTEIKSYTFNRCVNLRELPIEKNVQKIADNAFDYCTSLQKFIVNKDNVSYSSDNGILYTKDFKTLKRCPLALYSEELRIPDGVETIAPHAFDRCINIISFRLPETITTIGSGAFSDCKMKAISIPNNVSSIGSMAFWGCKELKSFAFPKLKTISSYTLWGCEKLEYLYIPSSVNKIESSAFYGCKSLNTIECHIIDINRLQVSYSESYDEYTSFDGIPADCTWHVPFGPENDIDNYARRYMQQPWWVSTWTIIPKFAADADVNSDGHIDIADAVTVLNAMAGEDVVGNADVNGDAIVDIADFVTVLNIMAGE